MYSANAEYMEYKCRIRVMQNTHRIQTQNTCHLVFCVFCMYSYMYSTCAEYNDSVPCIPHVQLVTGIKKPGIWRVRTVSQGFFGRCAAVRTVSQGSRRPLHVGYMTVTAPRPQSPFWLEHYQTIQQTIGVDSEALLLDTMDQGSQTSGIAFRSRATSEGVLLVSLQGLPQWCVCSKKRVLWGACTISQHKFLKIHTRFLNARVS